MNRNVELLPPRSRYERALPVNRNGCGDIIVGGAAIRLKTDLNAKPMIRNLSVRFIRVFCKTVNGAGYIARTHAAG